MCPRPTAHDPRPSSRRPSLHPLLRHPRHHFRPPGRNPHHHPPRADALAQSQPQKPAPLTIDQSYTTAEGDVIQTSERHGLRIELPSTASAARVSQAKFLERLSAIKARRGDTDAVPVTNVKTYRPPEGWQDERQEWIAKETARSERDKVEAAARMERLGKRSKYARLGHSETQELVQELNYQAAANNVERVVGA